MFPERSDIILMAHSTGKDTNTKLIDSVVNLKYGSLPLGMLLSASALHLRTISNKKIKNCKKHTDHERTEREDARSQCHGLTSAENERLNTCSEQLDKLLALISETEIRFSYLLNA